MSSSKSQSTRINFLVKTPKNSPKLGMLVSVLALTLASKFSFFSPAEVKPSAPVQIVSQPAEPVRVETVALEVPVQQEVVTPAAQKDELEVTLDSDSLFESGTAKLDIRSEAALLQIESILKNVNEMAVVEIEGHTDDSPVIRQKKFYPSNWELSAARAASLIPLLERAGIEKEQLRVVGYGDSRPVVPNRVPSNAKNRRIVLRVFPQGDLRKNL